MKRPTSLIDIVNEEHEVNASVADFLMKVIYPKLSEVQRQKVDLYLGNGIAVLGAFSLAGIKYSVKR
jgi:hypothetical protein